ncbi:MAG: hypothetical protein EHM70_11450 [Chloroflexota bacterium]|nr:MAG: hypothetical protein EHM70_11450 [Chloroflexota bacterium]
MIADAQIELGLYEDAVQTLQTMVDLRPDMASYSRISYIRELHGDTAGALEMMQWAVDSGSPNSENSAWTRTQLGNLFFNTGQLDQAEREYIRTLLDRPGYVYALAGLGRVYIAQGKVEEGTALLRDSSQVMPVPEFIITLADVFKQTGQMEAAQEQYDLLGVIQKLYQENGVDMDLEIALFNADHGLATSTTVDEVRQAYQRRPSIYAADVLAWVLYQNGEYEQARQYSEQALRLETKDALKLFHAGMIHYRLGDLDQARVDLEEAVGINPHFSILYAGEAQRILEELRGDHE